LFSFHWFILLTIFNYILISRNDKRQATPGPIPIPYNGIIHNAKQERDRHKTATGTMVLTTARPTAAATNCSRGRNGEQLRGRRLVDDDDDGVATTGRGTTTTTRTRTANERHDRRRPMAAFQPRTRRCLGLFGNIYFSFSFHFLSTNSIFLVLATTTTGVPDPSTTTLQK
jgi:hypothetical protein